MNNILVMCDCTCDLTDKILDKYSIEKVFFHIKTGTGVFRDSDELTAQNVFENMAKGGTNISQAPFVEEFITVFTKKLRDYKEIIYITISSGISISYQNCVEAVNRLGVSDRVFVIDSKSLSTGTGHLCIKAAEAIQKGMPASDIVNYLNNIKSKIKTSFIVYNMEYLYMNDKVSSKINSLCNTLSFHPVLEIINGQFHLKKIYFGDYHKAQLKYVREIMSDYNKMDTTRAFVTHAGCNVKELNAIVQEVNNHGTFTHFNITDASATISSNCGPHTFGLLYMIK